MKCVYSVAVALIAAFVPVFPSHAATPAAPNSLQTCAASASEIRLSWSDKSRNETGFKIQRAPDCSGNPGAWSQIATVGANVTSFRDKSLSPNTKYWYRVRAYNRSGESAFSSRDSAGTLPRPPTNLTATAVSTNQINLSWVPDSHGQGGFKIERSLNHKGRAGTWRQIATVGIAVTTYADKGLVSGTTYLYRVRAYNRAGYSAYSNVASASTPAPCLLSVAQWGYTYLNLPAGLKAVTAVAAGFSHSLALRSNGTVVGWGDDSHGQATPPTNLTGVVRIAASVSHSLALKSNGKVIGWGDDSTGAATPPTNLTSVIAIAAGYYHSLALRSDGTVVGWGDDGFGQATPPTNLTGVVAIAAGYYYSLALKGDGSVVVWGYNYGGQPTAPTNLTGVVAIAAGAFHNLALKSNGTVVAWGYDSAGSTAPPTNLTGVVAIAAGYDHSLALKNDGTVLGWGDNSFSQTTPEGLTGQATAIAAGGRYSLALTFAPSPPSPVTTILIATNQIKLSWSDNSANEDGFKIQRALDTVTNGIGPWTQIAIVGANATNYSDTSVVTNATYWYRVQAFNSWCGDSPYSFALAVSVAPPVAPYYLTATIGTTNLDLSWYYSANVDGFRIERAPELNGVPGTWTGIATVNATNIFSGYFYGRYNDPDVTANAAYWYRVQAFNALGNSPFSDAAFINVESPAPPNYLSATPSADRVNLSWYDSSGNSVGFKIERATDAGGVPGTWEEIATIPSLYQYTYTYYTDTGRTLNTTYWYRVRAYNWVGDSPYALPVSVTILLPAAPHSLTAIVGNTNRVNLSWYEYPADQDGFKIERAADAGGSPGTWTEIASQSVSNIGFGYHTDADVTANTTNWYRVRAFNSLGISAYSDPASVSVAPPVAPSLLTATPFADRVNLHWNSDDSYSAGIKGYKIERAPDAGGSPGTWTEVATIDAINGYTDTGRAANATYWYRVRAFNWVGNSSYSVMASATIVPPVAPSTPTATIGTTNQVNLSWNQPHADQDGFRIERAADNGGGPGVWTEIATVIAVNFGYGYYTDTNVSANTTNWYRIRAFNIVGVSPYSNPARINVVPSDAPTSLTANPFADRINLSWSENYAGEIGGFKIERAPDDGGDPGTWAEIATVTGFNTQYSDTGRAADTTYWYRVRTFTWVGPSPYSEPASATIVPPATPYALTATIGTTNQVNLSWYDDAGNQDGFKIERALDVGGSPGAWMEIAAINATNAHNVFYTDTNVAGYTTNWYRVRAFNSVGISFYSGPASVTVVPPGAPSSLTAFPFANRINLSWYNSSSVRTESYKIERAPDAGGSPGTWAEIATISDNGYNYYYHYEDSGRAPNTTYWYRVRAFNWVGYSSYSDPASVTIVPPAAPSSLTGAIGTTNQVNLSWYDSYADQSGFKVERAPDAGGIPGTWSEIATLSISNTSYGYYADTNVTAHTTNWYRVRAFNEVGISAYSDPASVSVVPPEIPLYLTATPFVNRVHLSWYDYDYYSAGIAGYKIERAPDAVGSPGTWAEIAAIQVNGSYNNYYEDTSLVANATYWYRVRAFNWIGDSHYSDPVGVIIVPPMTPSAPTAAIGATNQVNVSLYDNAADQDGFKIERAPDESGSPGTWMEIATINASNVNYAYYSDTNVTAHTTNWYRVRAFNVVGVSDYSGSTRVRIVPPDAPTSLTAQPIADRINLTWSDFNAFPASTAGYKIERAPDVGGSPGNWVQIATTVASGYYYSSYTDTGRMANTKYWYRIRGYNWIGDSPYSYPASATVVPPGAPTSLYAYLGTTNRVNLFWYDYFQDEDGFKVERAPDVGGSPGTWAEIASVNATNAYYAQYADTNAPVNATNWYRVRAFNAVGVSAFSPPVSISLVPPAAPDSLTATVAAVNQVNLRWFTTYSGGESQGYKIERAPDVGGSPGTWAQIAIEENVAVTRYSDTTVRVNRSYWYRVRAYNWIGDSPYGNLISVGIVPPGAPLNLTAANDWKNQVSLTWVNTNHAAVGFKIERAADAGGSPGGWTQIAWVGTTNYTDPGLEAGETYWYRVRSVNVVGDSPYSNEASATVRNGEFVRLMQWNVEHTLGRQANNFNYSAQAAARIINYNQPDVLLFNEIDAENLTAAENEAALIHWVTNNIDYLGAQPGVTFHVAVSSQTDGFNRNAAISRYPILSPTTHNDGLRGLHSFRVQISAADVLQVFHTHLKCCADDCARKQSEAQFDTNIIGSFAATNSLPYIFAGDWNEDEERQPSVCTITSTYHPIATIRQGAMLGEFKPVTLSGNPRTWSSQQTSPSIRFDYILAATNRIAPISGYVFSSMDWADHGLYSGSYYDSFYASDHYCIFANYFFPASASPKTAVNPLSPPTISWVVEANGQFTVQVSGNTGQTVVVEASTNLLDWLPVHTNTLDAGVLYFGDPASGSFQGRFYRARLP